MCFGYEMCLGTSIWEVYCFLNWPDLANTEFHYFSIYIVAILVKL